jgi:hypothetical protein
VSGSEETTEVLADAIADDEDEPGDRAADDLKSQKA